MTEAAQLEIPVNPYRHADQLVEEAIVKRWKLPEWGVFWEVSNATGGAPSRRADAVIVNMWPSRGLPIIGVEIKMHRSDWLRELKNPKKAEAIFRYCNQWWLVTGSKDVAKLDEIPDAWGWLAYDKGRNCLVQQKAAPNLDPEPPSKSFMCVLLRHSVERMEQMVHRKDISHVLSQKYNEGLVSGRESAERDFRFEKERFAERESLITGFEESSGVKFSRWEGGGRIGKVVGLLKDGGLDRVRNELSRLGTTASKLSADIAEAIAELNAVSDVIPKQNDE